MKHFLKIDKFCDKQVDVRTNAFCKLMALQNNFSLSISYFSLRFGGRSV
ncbi:hypothetical protein [Treponema pectinovorum]